MKRMMVSQDAAAAFRPGDDVEITFWRGSARKIAGEHYVWNQHIPKARDGWIGVGLFTLGGAALLVIAVRRFKTRAAARHQTNCAPSR